MSASAPLVIFVHMPKTAGSSVRQIIEQNISKTNRQFCFPGHIDEYNRVRNLPLEELPQVECLHGHHPWGMHQCYKNRSYKYFTFLREPVSRFLSEYSFALSDESGFAKSVQAKQTSLRRFIENPIAVLDNPYIRWVAGFHPREEISLTQKELCDLAKQRLVTDFNAFGLTEFFDQSLLLINKAIGWKPPLYQTRNVSGEKDDLAEMLPQDLKNRLLEYLRWDLELYEFALAEFKNRIADQPLSFCSL